MEGDPHRAVLRLPHAETAFQLFHDGIEFHVAIFVAEGSGFDLREIEDVAELLYGELGDVVAGVGDYGYCVDSHGHAVCVAVVGF